MLIRLKGSELNESLIAYLRENFAHSRIEIRLPDAEEISRPLTELLERKQQFDNGTAKIITFTEEELNRHAENLLHGKSV